MFLELSMNQLQQQLLMALKRQQLKKEKF